MGRHVLVHLSGDLRLQLANRVTQWAARTEHMQRARRLMYLLSAGPLCQDCWPKGRFIVP